MSDGDQNSLALEWLKDEVNESLKQASQALEFFVENPDDALELERCSEQLKQVAGTLRMVGIPGATAYVNEMLAISRGLTDGEVARGDAVYETLMRSPPIGDLEAVAMPP